MKFRSCSTRHRRDLSGRGDWEGQGRLMAGDYFWDRNGDLLIVFPTERLGLARVRMTRAKGEAGGLLHYWSGTRDCPTVEGSLSWPGLENPQWHGYLERGVLRGLTAKKDVV